MVALLAPEEGNVTAPQAQPQIRTQPVPAWRTVHRASFPLQTSSTHRVASCAVCPFAVEGYDRPNESAYYSIARAARNHHEKSGHRVVVRATFVTIYGDRKARKD
jgi:hypothetical protein